MNQKNFDQFSDAELLSRYASGMDEGAFAELVRRHGAMVRTASRRVLRNEQDAADAYQAAFIALANSADRVRWDESAAGWLHETTVRCAKAMGKMNAIWNRNTRLERAAEEPPRSAEEVEELQQAVHLALERVPRKYSAPVVLCDLEGLTRREAAERTKTPVSTVHSRLERGRELLRAQLLRRGFQYSASGIAAYSLVSGEVGAAEAASMAKTVSAVRLRRTEATETAKSAQAARVALRGGLLTPPSWALGVGIVSAIALGAATLMPRAPAESPNLIRQEFSPADVVEGRLTGWEAFNTEFTFTSDEQGRLVVQADGEGGLGMSRILSGDVAVELQFEFLGPSDIGLVLHGRETSPGGNHDNGYYARLWADGKLGHNCVQECGKFRPHRCIRRASQTGGAHCRRHRQGGCDAASVLRRLPQRLAVV